MLRVLALAVVLYFLVHILDTVEVLRTNLPVLRMIFFLSLYIFVHPSKDPSGKHVTMVFTPSWCYLIVSHVLAPDEGSVCVFVQLREELSREVEQLKKKVQLCLQGKDRGSHASCGKVLTSVTNDFCELYVCVCVCLSICGRV